MSWFGFGGAKKEEMPEFSGGAGEWLGGERGGGRRRV